MVIITAAESKLKQKLVPGSLGIAVIDLVMLGLEGMCGPLAGKPIECPKFSQLFCESLQEMLD